MAEPAYFSLMLDNFCSVRHVSCYNADDSPLVLWCGQLRQNSIVRQQTVLRQMLRLYQVYRFFSRDGLRLFSL
jgi:hypothetical protein